MVADNGMSTPEAEPTEDASGHRKLPSRLRLLCVGPREPSWVNLTLQLDAEGCLEPQFRWVSTANEALSLLRDESFDCVLVSDDSLMKSTGNASADPHHDSLALLRAIRASGCDDPIVLVTPRLADEHWAEFCQKDCELLLTPNMWESPAVLPVIKRAVSRVDVSRENHRLAVSNHRRLVRERDEADHLLKQQRQIISELEALARPMSGRVVSGQTKLQDLAQFGAFEFEGTGEITRSNFPLPNEVNGYYDELLRTYVIMGAGNLGEEIAKLAELLAIAGLSPREALALHLERVETLVRGLGNRSTRHVMARADLLALELMIHLGECYQRNLIAARAV